MVNIVPGQSASSRDDVLFDGQEEKAEATRDEDVQDSREPKGKDEEKEKEDNPVLLIPLLMSRP